MKLKLLIFLFLFNLLLILNCSEKEHSPLIPPDDPTPYTDNIQSVFDAKCISCHGETIAEQGLRLDSWENLIQGSDHSEAVIPYDAGNSLLYEMLTKLEVPHLSGADSITQVELSTINNWIEIGAKSDEGIVPHIGSTNRLYVCNQGSGMVSVIDVNIGHVIRNINFEELGFSDNSKPHDIAVDYDGNWYVSLIGDGKVLKFDKNYNLVGQVDFPAAGLLAINQQNSVLYAGHTLSLPDVPPTLAAINFHDMTLTPVSLPYSRPHALASGYFNNYVFNLSLVDNRISVINAGVDPENVHSVQILPGRNRTIVQINIAPDNNSAVVSSQFDQKLLILDISDVDSIFVTDSVDVGEQPWHPKFSLDGKKIYVGNNVSNTVSVVDVSSYQVETVIGAGDGTDGLAQPHGLVISEDISRIYVSNRNTNGLYTTRYDFGDNANTGTVVFINTNTNQIDKIVEIEKFPSGIVEIVTPVPIVN